MRSKIKTGMLQFLLFIGLLFFGGSASFGYLLTLDLVPSKVNLESGEDFDLDVWLFAGKDSGGHILFSSAEFNVLWNYPSACARLGSAPMLGSWVDAHDPFGFSYAEFTAPDRAHLSITPWYDIPVDDSGLLLATLPLRAGPTHSEATFSSDFFMEEEYGESSMWVSRRPLAASLTSDAFAAVNTVPLPGTVFLLGSGLLGLAALRRKRR